MVLIRKTRYCIKLALHGLVGCRVVTLFLSYGCCRTCSFSLFFDRRVTENGKNSYSELLLRHCAPHDETCHRVQIPSADKVLEKERRRNLVSPRRHTHTSFELCNQRILYGWLGAVVGAWSTCLLESVRRSGSCYGGSGVFKVRGANHFYQVLVVLPSSAAFSQTVSMPDTYHLRHVSPSTLRYPNLLRLRWCVVQRISSSRQAVSKERLCDPALSNVRAQQVDKKATTEPHNAVAQNRKSTPSCLSCWFNPLHD